MIVKRISAPKLWQFARKTKMRYAIAPKPGPHPKNKCLPLGYVLRDIFAIAETVREARGLLNSGIVKVDGIVRKDIGFPLGLMDVLTIGDQSWRILPGKHELELKSVKPDESSLKLLKVINKSHIGGKVQLNFHDGRNMLVDRDVYKTSDVVIYDSKSKTIKGSVQFKRGALVLITEGKERGKIGRVEDIIVLRGCQPNRVVVKSEKETIETLKNFAFAIGQDKPLISL